MADDEPEVEVEIVTPEHAPPEVRPPLAVSVDEDSLQPVHEYLHNHLALLEAFTEVVTAAEDRDPIPDALQACFAHLVRGLAAHRAVLLAPIPTGGFDLLAYTTTLTPAKLDAIQHGLSVRGVSSTIIRKVFESREPAIVQHPTLLKPAERTGALNDYDYSVLCAPVLDPTRRKVEAILYLQSRGGLINAYRVEDLRFLQKLVSLIERLLDFRQRLLGAMFPLDRPLDEMEAAFRKMVIENRLQYHEFDYAAVAQSLGLHHISVQRVMRELGITRKRAVANELRRRRTQPAGRGASSED